MTEQDPAKPPRQRIDQRTGCDADGCDKPHRSRGLCNVHYLEARKNGTLKNLAPQTPEERFWPKVRRRGTGECWEWLAGHNAYGYGSFSVGGRKGGHVQAHRFAYELLVGPIPDGLVLDHLCRNRNCVNPAHLDPTTLGDNVLRGEGPSARAARQTRCQRGHEFTPENTYITPKAKKRQCRACMAIRTESRSINNGI